MSLLRDSLTHPEWAQSSIHSNLSFARREERLGPIALQPVQAPFLHYSLDKEGAHTIDSLRWVSLIARSRAPPSPPGLRGGPASLPQPEAPAALGEGALGRDPRVDLGAPAGPRRALGHGTPPRTRGLPRGRESAHASPCGGRDGALETAREVGVLQRRGSHPEDAGGDQGALKSGLAGGAGSANTLVPRRGAGPGRHESAYTREYTVVRTRKHLTDRLIV